MGFHFKLRVEVFKQILLFWNLTNAKARALVGLNFNPKSNPKLNFKPSNSDIP